MALDFSPFPSAFILLLDNMEFYAMLWNAKKSLEITPPSQPKFLNSKFAAINMKEKEG